MLNVKIPKTKYDTATYANLDPSAKGSMIPEFWGVKTNITPVCIDTSALKYKISKRKCKAIDAVKTAGITRPYLLDYTRDLANGEFTFTKMTHGQASAQYYFVIEGDFAIDSSNHVEIWGDDDAGYTGGTAYYINDSDVWSDQGNDIDFVLYGRTTLGGSDSVLIDTPTPTTDWWATLRKTTSNVKIAQSFTMPASNYYLHQFRFWMRKVGSPVGDLWVSFHTDQSGTQSRIASTRLDVSTLGTSSTLVLIYFHQKDEVDGDIAVDAQGWYTNSTLMENVSDILKDCAENIVGVPTAQLDSTAFSNLKTARTQDHCVYMDEEMTFGEFVEKLERVLFKFVPQLDGTYAPIYYSSGEPAGTPHLKDEDFISFKCVRNLDSVYKTYRVKYNEDPTNGTYPEKTSDSKVAEYLYENEETLDIETYLKDAADATTLVGDYKTLLESPQRGIIFEVASYLLDKIPTDKVKITRARGDNTGGAFDAVLFRIFSLTKNQATGTTTCFAVLDSQTYVVAP